ncbi:hypothetical protein M0R89_14015 [Halorussus limi]|uniref:Uncharacterized protein n=1 Tax=Halorussus limi TaxID=2938695 RepID=A0A8U0HS07_9EURY|nr:hypothetical protein [Halorussus limi]UPV73649.1 hypothetical protein M0R89_14015 [Halorussus limi]
MSERSESENSSASLSESGPNGERGQSDESARSDETDQNGDSGRNLGGAANWLLVRGDRSVVVAGILAGVLLAVVAILWTMGYPAVRSASPVYFLLSSLVTGDLTLVTVVLSINQLVLSRELGAPGTLSERIQGAREFRAEVEESTETSVAPKSPSQFLRFLHGKVESETQRLADAAADAPDESLRERLGDLEESLSADVALVNRTLDSENGIFDVVAATIATNHGSQLHEITAIRTDCGDSLSEDLGDLLDDIETRLLQIDVARNYFETVYVQKELAYLSRLLLYVGLPAIVFDGLALVFYNALGPTPVPPPVVYAVLTVAFTVGFAPLAILFAFVLRLAWVAQRTATVAPFSSGQYR